MKKPINEINNLIEIMSSSNTLKLNIRRNLSLPHVTDDSLVIFKKGVFGVYRLSNHQLIFNIKSPWVLGFSLIEGDDYQLYARARTDCEYEVIKKEVAFELIERNNAWKDTCAVLMFLSSVCFQRSISTTGLLAFDIVRITLNELLEYDSALVENTNIADYVIEKTLLSRSAVMGILKDMKKSGLIVVNRGRLISISKSFSLTI